MGAHASTPRFWLLEKPLAYSSLKSSFNSAPKNSTARASFFQLSFF